MKLAPALLLITVFSAAAVTIQKYDSHDFTFSAATSGNPFEVKLTGEFTGPDGAHLSVPGFYDGDGNWKIRFSPPQPGNWSLRTSSPLEALNAKTESIVCEANTRSNFHGVLKVDAAHPLSLYLRGRRALFLLGYEARLALGARAD